MKFVVKEPTAGGLKVEEELVKQEGQSARAFQVGNKKNQQNMIHLEMTGATTGFWANDQKSSYFDFTEGGEEQRDDEAAAAAAADDDDEMEGEDEEEEDEDEYNPMGNQ